MSWNSSSSTPKATLLREVAKREGKDAATAIETAWAEDAFELSYQNKLEPPVSQRHVDRLVAEKQFDKVFEHNFYPWYDQALVSDTSEPWLPDYFHYWFERDRLDQDAAKAVDGGAGNPSSSTDTHSAAWEKVLAHKQGIHARVTKDELMKRYEEAQQHTKTLLGMAGKHKKSAAYEKDRRRRDLEEEKDKHRRELDKAKEQSDRKLAEEETLNWKVIDQLERKNMKLESKLKQMTPKQTPPTVEHYGSYHQANSTGALQQQQDRTRLEADKLQRQIQANYTRALEGQFDKTADNINEKSETIRELQHQLGRAQARAKALERENDELREKTGTAVKVKKEETTSLKLEDIQSVGVKQEGGGGGGSRKRNYTDMVFF